MVKQKERIDRKLKIDEQNDTVSLLYRLLCGVDKAWGGGEAGTTFFGILSGINLQQQPLFSA